MLHRSLAEHNRQYRAWFAGVADQEDYQFTLPQAYHQHIYNNTCQDTCTNINIYSHKYNHNNTKFSSREWFLQGGGMYWMFDVAVQGGALKILCR